MRLSEVTARIPYTNTFTNEQKTFDPRSEGFFALVATERVALDGNRFLSLAYGSVSSPRQTLQQVVAELALTIALYPAAEPFLKLVKLPCVFSSLEAHVEVDYVISDELMTEARATAQKFNRFRDHHYTALYERRHGLR